MNARLERKLRLVAVVVAAKRDRSRHLYPRTGVNTAIGIAVGISYGLLYQCRDGGHFAVRAGGPAAPVARAAFRFVAQFDCAKRNLRSDHRSILFFQLGNIIAGVPVGSISQDLVTDIIYAVAFLVLANLVIGSPTSSGPARS